MSNATTSVSELTPAHSLRPERMRALRDVRIGAALQFLPTPAGQAPAPSPPKANAKSQSVAIGHFGTD